MWRKLSVMLAFILELVLLLVSCGSGEVQSKTPVENPNTVDSAETTADEFGYVAPNVEKEDFGGRKFNIIYPQWSLYNHYYFATEYNGEVVNDAIYDRARYVEEMLNIKFEYITRGYIETILPEVQKVVRAGDPGYDLALTHCATSLLSYVTDKLVLNWNDIPGADLSMLYWNQSVRESFEVYGMLPFMSSDYILPDVNSIFFNKGIIDDMKLEDPYELVLSGKWTWDKLKAMATEATKDLNGNSKMDDEDQYGFVGERGWQFTSALISCNQFLFGKGPDNLPAILCDNEKTQNVLDLICGIIHNKSIAYTWAHSSAYDPNQGGKPPVDFRSNRSLFYLTPLSLATTFRDAEVDYGIIPLPKYDEAQDNYLTLNWAGFMCVPASVSDPRLVGLVSELLAAESSRTVIPAFYDVLLGEKIARDPISKKMLDIIFEWNVYDLGVNLGYYGLFSSQIDSSKPNNSRYLRAQRNTIEKVISDYVEGCKEYMELTSK